MLKRYTKEELIEFIKHRPKVIATDETHLMNWVDDGGYTIGKPHKWVDAGGWHYCQSCCMAQSAPDLTPDCKGK